VRETAFEAPVFNDPVRGSSLVERQPLRVEAVWDLSQVPVLPETLLLLDLMVQEHCVDLRRMSELVLADLGATLQIMRLAAREYGHAEGRPIRIADCICDLGVKACFEAISGQPVARDRGQQAVVEFWAHSKEIGQYAKLAAEGMPEVDPDEAYLVGLFHAIGLLPALLGWRESGVADAALSGLRFAKRWSLPPCVTAFFTEMQLGGYATRWSSVVHMAHQRSIRSTIHCPFEQDLRPHLHRDGFMPMEQAILR